MNRSRSVTELRTQTIVYNYATLWLAWNISEFKSYMFARKYQTKEYDS